MNKEDRNSFLKEMLGKLEEQWAKSNSPEDNLFYYHPSEDKIVLSHALFWVMPPNIKGKVGKEKYLLLLRQYQEEMFEASSEHVRLPYPLRCSQAIRYNDCRWRLWW